MSDLQQHAQNIRCNILDAGYKAGAMHFGGSLSIADVMAYLYGEEMRYEANRPDWPGRDRFILSKGHCALALYATLCEFGFITREQLMTVDDNGGSFPSHCVQNIRYGIELSSGSLGIGLSFALGQALALKDGQRLFVVVGNGEINEGCFWEAAMFAGHNRLANLCVVVDDNGMQLDGLSDHVMPVKNWDEKLKAFDWTVVNANGHDFGSLRSAFRTDRAGHPLAVIAHTVKGRGVSFMERAAEWHHNKMSEDLYKLAISENGGAR